MLKILLIFLLLSTQPLFLVSRLKQRFEVALPICCMLDILILMAFGMVFKNLTAGVAAVFILALVSLLAALCCESRDLRGFFIRLTTPGFWAWCAGYWLMWAFSYKKFFMEWDAFLHWGPFVKQMFIHNKLYTEPDVSILIHKYYPPAVSLFEYMFTRIWGSYSESAVFAAFRVLQFVCVLPFTVVIAKGQNLKAIVTGLTAFFFTMAFVTFERFNYTIMVDAHLSLMFALFIYCAVFDRKNPLQKINCAIIGITLTLTKVTGFEFALVGMGVYAIIEIIDIKNRINKPKRIKLSKIAINALLWSLPIVAYFVWKYFTKNIAHEFSLPPTASGGTSIGTVISWLTLNGGDIKNNVLSAAVYLWLTMKMTSGWLPLYNPVIVIGFIMLMYCLKMSEKDRFVSKYYTVLTVVLPIGYFIYSLSLTVVMLLNNGLIAKNGGDKVNSFNRYLASYACGMGLVLLIATIRHITVSANNGAVSKKLTQYALPILVLIMLPPAVFQYLAPLGQDGYDATEYKKYTKAEQNATLFSSAASKNAKARIYFVYCNEKGIDELSYWKNHYWLKPAETNNIELSNPFGEESLSPYSTYSNDVEWGTALLDRGFTHVLLYEVDDVFKNRFFKMFDCTYAQIRPNTLFEVVLNKEEAVPVKLVPIDVPIYAY